MHDHLKTSPDSGIIPTMLRVIRASGRSPDRFLAGLLWRLTERVLDLLPVLIAGLWLLTLSGLGGSWLGELFHMPVPYLSGYLSGYLNGYLSPSWSSPLGLFLILCLLFSLQMVTAWVGQKHSFSGGYDMISGYRKRMAETVHRLPPGILARYRSGQLTDMMTDDIERIETVFTHLAVDLLCALILPLLIGIGLCFVDITLGVSVLIGFPVAVLFLQLSRPFFIRVSRKKQAVIRDASAQVLEFVSGLKTLHLFNRTGLWQNRLSGQFNRMTQASVQLEIWGAGPVVLYRILMESGLIALLLLIAWQAGHSTSTDGLAQTGGWLLAILLAYRVISPLLEMAEHLAVLRFALQSEHKLHQLRSHPPLPEPDYPVCPAHAGLEVRNLSFAYDQEPVLHQVSFSVPAGSVVAITGPSGSGKSTLLSLIARFYDPVQGYIMLGGEDLRAIGTDQLYQQLSMVFQKVQLFDGSVLDNLKIAAPDATEQEIIRACQAACCDEFIRSLPEGYQTRIGEGGSVLSGGERQRLCIARALLKDAPLLLLDEATASVDTETQYAIQQGLNQLVRGKTVVIVAHRLSTIRFADHILVMDEGHLVQQGTHDELLAEKGLYRSLWLAQEGEHQ